MKKKIDQKVRKSIESFVEDFRKNRHKELKHILDNIKGLDFFEKGILYEDILSDYVSDVCESRKFESRILKSVVKPTIPSPEEKLEKLTKAIQEYAKAAKNAVIFHDLLLEYFSKSNMTQKSLATRADVNYYTLNSILNNHPHNNLSRDYILKLCLAMKLSIDETDKLLCSAGYILIGIDDREIENKSCNCKWF